MDKNITPGPGTHQSEDVTTGAPSDAAVVLEQTARMMVPLVRLLLAHGVTYPLLAETMKSIFINTAQDEYKRNNERLTDSKLAVATGIHRKDVKRLRAEQHQSQANAAEEAPQTLTAAIFTRWLTDAAYSNPDGTPKILRRHGNIPDKTPNFEDLVKSISTDVHPRTVLNELLRLEMVKLEGDAVRLLAETFVPNPDFAQMIGILGDNLHDHAAAATHNLMKKSPAFLEQSIYSDAIPPAAIAELATLARREWSHIMKTYVPKVAQLEEQGARDAQNVTGGTGASRKPSARMRLGMYFFGEEDIASSSTEHGSSTK